MTLRGARGWWLLAIATVLVLDPITTAAALHLAPGHEATPTLAGIVHNQQWAAMLGAKVAALGVAWAAWRYVPGWDLRRYVPPAAAGIGTVAVVNNVLVLSLALAGVA